MTDNERIAKTLRDLNPDANVLLITDQQGNVFVIAYSGQHWDVPGMYRKRGFKVTQVTELEAAS